MRPTRIDRVVMLALMAAPIGLRRRKRYLWNYSPQKDAPAARLRMHCSAR